MPLLFALRNACQWRFLMKTGIPSFTLQSAEELYGVSTVSFFSLSRRDIQYKVVRHKCQYKYVGGKRFVMVRKILQVKEIGRLQTEEYLKRQFHKSVDEGGATL